jgi:hypothetical protein
VEKWVSLDMDKAPFSTAEEFGGVISTVTPSPYDVPKALAYSYNPGDQLLTLEFQYIGQEPTGREPGVAGVSVNVGKNSGRIYGIDIRVDPKVTVEGLVGAIVHPIHESINRLSAKPERGVRRSNYSMVKTAVGSIRDDLLAVIKV